MNAIEEMQAVCKEWAIKDDKLAKRMSALKARYENSLKHERQAFNIRQPNDASEEPDNINDFSEAAVDGEGSSLSKQKLFQCEQVLSKLYTSLEQAFAQKNSVHFLSDLGIKQKIRTALESILVLGLDDSIIKIGEKRDFMFTDLYDQHIDSRFHLKLDYESPIMSFDQLTHLVAEINN